MRIYEIDDSKLKSRVKKAVDRLDDADPAQKQVLVHVKNTIFNSVLQKTLESSGLRDKLGKTPYDWFANILEVAKVPLEDKVNLIKLISNPENLMSESVFTSNTQGTVTQYINGKIKNNPAFKAIADQIWNYKIGGQGGMGPAELFFVMFAQDARKVSSKEGGDVAIGNWKVELKREGSVSPGSSSHRVVDKLNANLISTATKEGFIEEVIPGYQGQVPATSVNSGWLPDFFKVYGKKHGASAAKTMFSDYLQSLYGDGSAPYVDSVFSKLGTDQAERALAPMILQMYKDIHKWDSICFVSDGFKMVNLVDLTQLPESLTTSIKLKRGGDTQAVADGYMNVGIASDKKTKSSAPQPVQKAPTPGQKASPPSPTPAKDTALQQPGASINDLLQNTNGPVAQVIAQMAPDQAEQAKNQVEQLLNSGKTEQQIADELSSTLAESTIFRLKYLSTYKNS